MTDQSVHTYNASASMLGYLYQVRVALLWALQQAKVGEFSVSLETLDDVTLEANGIPISVLQTKHSIVKKANLTDTSADLWKTLRVWLVGNASGEVPIDTSLFLITTASITDGTAAQALCAHAPERDIKIAGNRLRQAAANSSNDALKDVFAAFLALSQSDQEKLLNRVVVVPDEGNASEILTKIEQELHWMTLHHQKTALELLEGWWFKRVVHELVNDGCGISRTELEAQISDIQDSLKPDALPIDDAIEKLMVALDQLPEFSSRNFYRQVELVGAGKNRILNAINSYQRAFAQRSQWTRDELLFDTDISKYECTLKTEWLLKRDQICDELGDSPADEAMAKAGREVLKWAEDVVLPIRPNVATHWVCRGSLHMLADELKIGWHPNFEDRLSEILAVESGPVAGTA
ncbi:ABC-three component system protein [Undibacterium sp. Ji50W]|uniref:ABC-three component system protein n=1 Tax=Undibacterium sp. Ji50W TaxID=3413041 RepID=UPI003BF3A278